MGLKKCNLCSDSGVTCQLIPFQFSEQVTTQKPHYTLDKSLNQVRCFWRSGRESSLHNSRAIKWNKKIKWIPKDAQRQWQWRWRRRWRRCRVAATAEAAPAALWRKGINVKSSQITLNAFALLVCVYACDWQQWPLGGWVSRTRRLKTKTIKAQSDSISFLGALESMLHPLSHTHIATHLHTYIIYSAFNTHTHIDQHRAEYAAALALALGVAGSAIKPI